MYGFELAPVPDKVECGPRLDFVGITFDCRAQELSIRPEKCAKAHAFEVALHVRSRGACENEFVHHSVKIVAHVPRLVEVLIGADNLPR